MKLTEEAEYINSKGEYDYIVVEFEGNPQWDNDSFSYAGTHCTHGIAGVHKLPDYSTMEGSEITWDKTLYNNEQDNIIEAHVKKNYENIEELFCNELKKEREEHCDF